MTAHNPSSVGLVERVRMALAEAGYPDPSLVEPGTDDEGPHVRLGPGGVPEAVCWRAHAVTHPEATACWPCWDNNEGHLCTHPVVLSEAPL